jgi:hypothetical protein
MIEIQTLEQNSPAALAARLQKDLLHKVSKENAALKLENAELYRKLAAAELSARQGWERYENSNRAHINLQMKYAAQWETK